MRTTSTLAVGAGSFGTVLALAASLVLLPTSSPSSHAQDGSGQGTIKGRVVWGGADVPKPTQIKPIEKDPQVCAATPLFERGISVDPASKGLAHAFVYLAVPKSAPADARNPEKVRALVAKAPKVEIDQKNCEFLPYALAMHQEQTLVFKSSDPVGHNVRYSGFSNPPKNVTLAPNGQLEVTLKADRFPMPVNCDIHPWMKAYIMVFDHPFFQVTGADGSFELTGVPAGEHKLIASLPEKVGFITTPTTGMTVVVKAGETTDVGMITLDPAKVKK